MLFCLAGSMTEEVRQQAHWAQLPASLWVRIMARLRDPLKEMSALAQQQCWYFQLPTVCQAFKKVFADHPRLYNTICVHSRLAGHHLPGLMAWLQCHSQSVSRLVINDSTPWLEAALVALQSPQSCLTRVHMNCLMPETAVFLLSTFQAITNCTINAKTTADNVQAVNLRPLQGLPNLTNLSLLSGRFVGLEALAHISFLSLRAAAAKCQHTSSLATALVNLDLHSATLELFYTRGLCPCQSLHSLHINMSDITAATPDENMYLASGRFYQIPMGLSALTALTTLKVVFAGKESVIEFDWLSKMTGLRHFSIDTSASTLFPQQISLMQQLSTLHVETKYVRKCKSNLRFDFAWSSLASLQSLYLVNAAMCMQEMRDLAAVPSLKQVCLHKL